METKPKKYLGPKGYSIRKDCLSIDEQIDLRDDLTVKAFIPKNSMQKATPFPVYRESKTKFYVPKFYGLKRFGPYEYESIGDGDVIDLKFKGELRPYQKPIVDTYIKKAYEIGGGLLEVAVGFGKCHAKGTPIMMSNGEIKSVENIKVGDTLMGDDSKPRTVLSLARGKEMMYEIKPIKGESYVVNESHILSLRCSFTRGKYKKNEIVDICVKDYLKLPKHIKKNMLKGYKVPIEFEEKYVEIDPYVLGCWLGDGTSKLSQITSIDEPIIDSFKRYSESLGLFVRQGSGRDNITYTASYGKKNRKGISGSRGKNPFLNLLRKYNVLNNKHIPFEYKCNSRNVRLNILAGIIDTDGSLIYNGCYDIIQKNEKLLDDIIYVARSLGFAAYKKECKKSCMYKGEKKTGTYYRTTIHGEGLEEIPVKLERKKSRKRTQKKNALNVGISVIKKEVDDYYGFEIDGNRRFLLGDFTVTHNTIMTLNIISKLKRKTLIIVHKEFLLRQWIERIEEFLPGARVGRIQGEVMDIKDKDIVIGMLQSLSMKDYPRSVFNSFGLTAFDECFPYKTRIQTCEGLIRIGSLYEKWKNKEELPEILSFNRETKKFEYKKMTYAWRKEREDLIKIKMSKRVINCTPEHKILTTKGYIKANELIEGNLIISKYDKNHIDNIIAPSLNEDQLQIIYGSYLGDGHIGITKKNRYRLRVTHCEKQKEYISWKANMFGIKKLIYIEKNGYSQKPVYNFQTKIFDLEYKITKNTKIVPDWLLNKLDERGIAVWYMDDGSIQKHENKDGSKSNYVSLHTNNFCYETHEKFVKKFNTYGIECKISKSRKYYYLRFNKENSEKLLKLIKPYIHVSMNYKINERQEKYVWSNTFLDYGTLKVTQISYFKNKGANRCKKPYVYDIEVDGNHNFIIGSPCQKGKYIDGPVVSNCHHMAAEVFSRALFKIVTNKMLGLSATMKRSDNLSKVFKMFIGPIVYTKRREGGDGVVVQVIDYENKDEEYSQVELNWKGQVHYSKMIKKICEFNHRSEFILKVLEKMLKDELCKQIMILGHNKVLLKYLHDAIEHRNMASVGYYVGGMKEKDLKISETKKVVIATYAMASEGLDIKTLSTLIMATPKSSVEQCIGRILRTKHERPLVVDIVDQHEFFNRQWIKRKRFYAKEKYKIKRTNNKSYFKNEWLTLFDGKRMKAYNEKKANELLNGKCLIQPDSDSD